MLKRKHIPIEIVDLLTNLNRQTLDQIVAIDKENILLYEYTMYSFFIIYIVTKMQTYQMGKKYTATFTTTLNLLNKKKKNTVFQIRRVVRTPLQSIQVEPVFLTYLVHRPLFETDKCGIMLKSTKLSKALRNKAVDELVNITRL